MQYFATIQSLSDALRKDDFIQTTIMQHSYPKTKNLGKIKDN